MNKFIEKDRFYQIVNKLHEIEPLIVVGDIGIDKYTFGEVNKISPEAPVPVLEVKKEWLKLGLASNISHNLQTLGIKSTICGLIGEDSNANTFETLLEESKLSTWGVVREEGRPTTFKERITTNTQQICRVDYESSDYLNPNEEQRLIDRIAEFKDTHGALILSDYAKGTLSKSLIANLLADFKKRKKLTSVDPGRTTDPTLYKGVDLIKPNLIEAKIMAKRLGEHSEELEVVARAITDKLEIPKIVITLGAKGMAILDKSISNEFTYIPTVANEVYDVSGAGDTSMSLLVAAIEAGANLVEASWVSNCAAGVVVAKKGTATVNKNELIHYYETLSSKLQ